MLDAKSCDGCSQAHDCQRVYEQLGCANGPSIALKVFVAFALPILVFVVALATFGSFLRERLDEQYLNPVAFILALAVTVGVMLPISVAVRRHHRKP